MGWNLPRKEAGKELLQEEGAWAVSEAGRCPVIIKSDWMKRYDRERWQGGGGAREEG